MTFPVRNFVFLLGLLLYGTPGIAQQIRLADVVRQRPPRRSIERNTPLRVDIDPNMLRQVGGATEIRARLLRGSIAELRRLPTTKDNCVVLITRSLYVTDGGDGTLDLHFAFGDEWVLISNGRPVDGVYVLVFERANSTGDEIKIQKKDLPKYLAKGFEFTLRAPAGLSRSKIQEITPYSTRFRSYSAVGICHVFIAAADGGGTFADLEDCGSHSRGRSAPNHSTALVIEPAINPEPWPCLPNRIATLLGAQRQVQYRDVSVP